MEFSHALADVRSWAASSLGRDAVEGLEPQSELAAIQWELDRTREMIAAVGTEGLTIEGLDDLASVLKRASETTSLDADDFLKIVRTLESARRLRDAVEALEDEYEHLPALADRIGVFRELEGAIRRTFDEDGQMLETASPQLKKLSRRKRTLEERVEDKLKSFLNARQNSGAIREAIITRRSNRLVVPIKSHAKRELDCVVHDSSDSGQTLYVEPRAVVETNNEIRELESDIRDEKLRILRQLTAKVQDESRKIEETLHALAKLDGLYARARYALHCGATIPKLNTNGRIRLIEARHPLLDAETVVPISVDFGDRQRGMLITGPNTGGKTVTLKTVGLLTLMAQAGLPIPAEDESEINVFPHVRSDVGDEQSIQQNLSTFSSHMKNIIGFIDEIDEQSLVLIDELGAGTDPREGAALGLGILQRLLDTECRMVVTTHFGALKHFAYKTEQLKTCSVEFDVTTLQPTYRLMEGVGSSNAFVIAERLGMPSDVIDGAKASMAEGAVKAEELIRMLEQERADLSEARAQLDREREAVESDRARYQRRLTELEAGKSTELREEIRELENQLKQARSEIETALHEAREADEADLRQRLKRLQSVGEAMGEAAEEAFETSDAPLALADLEVGMGVYVRPVAQEGVVRNVDNEQRIIVEVDEMRIEVELDDLERAGSSPAEPRPPSVSGERRRSQVSVEASSTTGVGLELNLRGMTVDEALREVDQYLDRLVLSNVERARLIHGKGTGTLRREVRAQLDNDPRVVRSYAAPPSEGGDGATVVEVTS
ncbi:MAG: endonuclease MutS2 [Candidatus Bipolaricaulia bacterium]